MKTTRILLLALIAICLGGCHTGSPRQTQAHCLYHLVDMTTEGETNGPKVTANKCLELIGFDLEDGRNLSGIAYQLSTITDLSRNKVMKAVLDPGEDGMNKLNRQDELKAFQTEADGLYQHLSGETEIGNTVLHRRLVDAFTEIQSGGFSGKKIMVIESDMLEHDENKDKVSFYRDHRLLSEVPETVIEKQEAQSGVMPDLAGISIYIVHQPQDRSEDQLSGIATEFYKNYLESKGASVKVSSNL